MKVKIVYCGPCGYLPEARDLERAIEAKVSGADVELEEGDRGIFDVFSGDKLIFSRYKEGRFPETEEILQQIK